jgi:hypothetical protein
MPYMCLKLCTLLILPTDGVNFIERQLRNKVIGSSSIHPYWLKLKTNFYDMWHIHGGEHSYSDLLIMMPCSLENGYKHFWETYCLHFHTSILQMEAVYSSKMLAPSYLTMWWLIQLTTIATNILVTHQQQHAEHRILCGLSNSEWKGRYYTQQKIQPSYKFNKWSKHE